MKNYKVIACGISGKYRPNVILEDENGDKLTKWYHTTFYKVNDALEYLKDLYQEGISQNDINHGYWLTLKELQKQGD